MSSPSVTTLSFDRLILFRPPICPSCCPLRKEKTEKIQHEKQNEQVYLRKNETKCERNNEKTEKCADEIHARKRNERWQNATIKMMATHRNVMCVAARRESRRVKRENVKKTQTRNAE